MPAIKFFKSFYVQRSIKSKINKSSSKQIIMVNIFSFKYFDFDLFALQILGCILTACSFINKFFQLYEHA